MTSTGFCELRCGIRRSVFGIRLRLMCDFYLWSLRINLKLIRINYKIVGPTF
ncbi:hypothetical protein D1AOALGA4SA_8176 [Olavius algarvensis Delta 1 endosymbiont]|nr:hypothetical protein D1AOALGA4SA_8176 [Olavius algarvensis Delta 1 endosymbiont]